jgi:hypothetical protein
MSSRHTVSTSSFSHLCPTQLVVDPLRETSCASFVESKRRAGGDPKGEKIVYELLNSKERSPTADEHRRCSEFQMLHELRLPKNGMVCGLDGGAEGAKLWPSFKG